MWTRRGALGGMGVAGLMPATWALATSPYPPALLNGQMVQGGWVLGSEAFASSLLLDGKLLPVEQGHFFIGFDRDAGRQFTLNLNGAGGTIENRILTIAPRDWPIEHVDIPFHPPAVPDEAFARLRAAELARIDAARAHDTGAQGWRQGFIWPAHGRISGRFGSQRIYRGTPAAYHSGLDIAAGAGATYVAPADGVVVLAAQAPFTLEGNLLMVDHGMGLNSAFLHAQRLLVREGDRVAQGQPLGLVGMTGRATGPHLHWSLRWREARLDPLLILPPA
jgi:hypothetical protein